MSKRRSTAPVLSLSAGSSGGGGGSRRFLTPLRCLSAGAGAASVSSLGASSSSRRLRRGSGAASVASAGSGKSLFRQLSAGAAAGCGRSCVMVISEGRGSKSRELGIAILDADTASLELAKLSDSLTYQKLQALICWLEPSHIVLPDTLCNADYYQLFRLLADKFPQCCLVSAPRIYFNDDEGCRFLHSVCHKDCKAVLQQLPQCIFLYYSCSALARYAELEMSTVYAGHCLRVAYLNAAGSLVMDYETVRQLELVESLDSGRDRRGNQLLSVLNYTLTGGGARLLRMSLLQPLTDLGAIAARQDCVWQLRNRPQLLQQLREHLKNFSYFSCIAALCKRRAVAEPTFNVARVRINQILYVYHMLSSLAPLRDAMRPLQHPLFGNFRHAMSLPQLQRLRDKLRLLLSPGCRYSRGRLTMHTQRINAVRVGVNASLDRLRQIYAGQVAAAGELAELQAARLGAELQLSHTAARGFHLVCSRQQLHTLLARWRNDEAADGDGDAAASAGGSGSGLLTGDSFNSRPAPAGVATDASRLPSNMLQLHAGAKSCRFTTRELAELNAEIDATVEAVYQLTLRIFELLFESLGDFAMDVYKCVDAVSNTDLLCSLALAGIQNGWRRPTFGDSTEWTDASHPILHRLAAGRLLPNSGVLAPDSRLLLLTGRDCDCTALLKQVCLMQVMAQIGSDVPAAAAQFRISSRLFALLPAGDSGDTGADASAEFDKISACSSELTPDSLLVVDRLGAGLRESERRSLLAAFVPKLAACGAFVLVACCCTQPPPAAAACPGAAVLHLPPAFADDNRDGQRWNSTSAGSQSGAAAAAVTAAADLGF